MTFDPIPYQLLPTDGDVGALLHWAIVVFSCLGIVLVISMLTSLGVWGVAGVGSVGRQLSEGLADTFGLSLRRTWALARLTFIEAIRRKSLLVFVVFALLFMFAGWFLSDTNPRADLQVKVYVSFVLTVISWLILPVMLLLSCWSLPEDIKSRTLHTVVTKPARKNEIVLGRMLGFVLIGTVIVSIMGGVGYIWINRQLTSPAAKARPRPVKTTTRTQSSICAWARNSISSRLQRWVKAFRVSGRLKATRAIPGSCFSTSKPSNLPVSIGPLLAGAVVHCR